MNSYSQRSVAIIIPEVNFHDTELIIPKSILEKNGFKVFIASEGRNLSIGHYGLRIKPDMYLSNLHAENFVALALVGGEGSKILYNNNLVHKILLDFYKKGKIIAGICSAVGILASANLLKGKKVTCFPKDKDFIKASGAEVSEKPIEVDDRIITAAGPESAELFGVTLVDLIHKSVRR